MTDLDERLRSLDALTGPDLWGDIERREPRAPVPERSPRRPLAAALALVLAAAAIALAGRAFFSESRRAGSRPTPTPTGQTLQPRQLPVTNGEIWARVGGGDGPSYVYAVQPDGSGEALLFSFGDPTHSNDFWAVGEDYSWSPDGSRVAYSKGFIPKDSRDALWEIFVMNADGSGITQLSHNQALASEPAWSPDGTRFAFAVSREADPSIGGFIAGCDGSYLCPSDIYLMNADGTGEVQLTSNPADDSWPSWSPDGSRIAFVSSRNDRFGDIFVMNADGTAVIQLTSGPAGDTQPAWSPDGTRIAFVSLRDGSPDVWVMNADGSDLHRLFETDTDTDVWFAWSPDGSQIAFDRGSSGTEYEVWVANADGTDARRIAGTEHGGHGDLAWRPVLAG